MTTRSSSHRGLLVGLLGLAAFASGAVAMTAHSTGAPAPAAAATAGTLSGADTTQLTIRGDGDGDRRDLLVRGGRGR